MWLRLRLFACMPAHWASADWADSFGIPRFLVLARVGLGVCARFCGTPHEGIGPKPHPRNCVVAVRKVFLRASSPVLWEAEGIRPILRYSA